MPSGAVLSVDTSETMYGSLQSGMLRMGFGQHSVAVLRYRIPTGQRTTAPIIPERTPIILTFGQLPLDIAQFYGYVHHHEVLPASDGELNTYMLEYTIIGTSMPLNQQYTRSWTEVSASYVARSIGTDHQFRTQLHRHPRIFDYLAQSGVSDFAMLQRMADEVGYRFWCHNGTLLFVDPSILLAGPKTATIPTFRLDKVPGRKDSIGSFAMVAGTMVNDGGVVANRRLYGYDPRSESFFEAHDTDPNAYLSLVSTTAASSLSDAYATLEAEKLKNRNWLTAEASVAGTATLRPGSLVLLLGDALPASSRGYWLIDKVDHSIDVGVPGRTETQRYSSQLSLLRNNDDSVTFEDSHQLQPSREDAQARLNHDNVWESDLIEEIYLG